MNGKVFNDIPISSLENLLNEVAEDEENRLYIVFKSSNRFLKRNRHCSLHRRRKIETHINWFALQFAYQTIACVTQSLSARIDF